VFVIETTVFVVCVLILLVVSISRDLLRNWRKSKQAKKLSEQLSQLRGLQSKAATGAFGFPDEVIDGPSGRKMFIWKKGEQRPDLTISIVVDELDRIEQGSFKQR
jgi:hypothetical protein